MCHAAGYMSVESQRSRVWENIKISNTQKKRKKGTGHGSTHTNSSTEEVEADEFLSA